MWQLTVSGSKCSVLDIGKSIVPLSSLHIRNDVLSVNEVSIDLGIIITDDLNPEPTYILPLARPTNVLMPYCAAFCLVTLPCLSVHLLHMFAHLLNTTVLCGRRIISRMLKQLNVFNVDSLNVCLD